MKKILSIILALILVVLCVVSCDDTNSAATSSSTLSSIEITKLPTKLEYTVGERLDTSGMVVTAKYTNGKSSVVKSYSVDTDMLSKEGTITVKVSFTEGEITKKASFEVTVKNPKYTVTFVKNDTKAESPSFETKVVTYNSNYGQLPTIEMANHTFIGWSDAPNGGNLITADSKVTKTSNHYLYAQWVENGKYKVRFICNDCTGGIVPSDMESYFGQEIILPGNSGNLVKTNYIFDGWQTFEHVYAAGSSIISNDEPFIVLYAKWTGETYSIAYNYNGGEAPVIANPTTYTCGVGVSAFNNPIRFNYSFTGWYCEETQKNITSISTEDVGNKTLVAQWEFRRGSASITGGKQQKWVQLWEGGPKWAEFNVGSTITDYSTVTSTVVSEAYSKANVGGLYQFGGTLNKDNRNIAGVSFVEGISIDIKGIGFSGEVEGSLGDTAHILWGSNWRMPTASQLDSLKTKCNWEWCDGQTGLGHMQYVDGCTLAGYRVSGKNEYSQNNIFLPAAGNFSSSEVHNQGTSGAYWSSNSSITSSTSAQVFDFVSPGIPQPMSVVDAYGYLGYSVRAVLNEYQ